MSNMVTITDVVTQGKGITTLRFPFSGGSPGQFVMVWIPGIDEIPMSMSYQGDMAGITVKEVGEATAALSALRPGDLIGIRGPYGRGWDIPPGRVLCVGGGVGMAPLMAALDAIDDPSRVDVAIGARNIGEIIFEERARGRSDDVRVSTDDGTHGVKGTVVALASQMMREKSYDAVLGCGPEIMLRFLLQACKEAEVPCQVSLERLMKCGSGLCGSCVVDGLRVCADGPVFFDHEVKNMSEFGRCRRTASGGKDRV
ncbi:MAG: dihydroorotate dehydrogenase electron transfer subunit [Euryarchaeota archaeon]|nr:dihydroorotate dehydrogenase electron transfer subunit [Euryarchaeota archaeon]